MISLGFILIMIEHYRKLQHFISNKITKYKDKNNHNFLLINKKQKLHVMQKISSCIHFQGKVIHGSFLFVLFSEETLRNIQSLF